MWSEQNSSTAGQGLFPPWLRSTVGPLLLMLLTLPFASLLLLSCSAYSGSLPALFAALYASPSAVLQSAFLAPTAATRLAVAAALDGLAPPPVALYIASAGLYFQ